MESKKINQLATELSPVLSDLTIIGDPTTGISKKITLSQMASLFTGTVEEYPNLASFPLVGTADTIYIALDTNVLYRWNTGTNAYVELSPNIINSLVFNDANGFDGTISLVGSVATLTITTALTTGSVGFIGASGALLQDNANFFWDDTNNRLGLGTNAPTTAIDVFGSGIIGRLNGTSTNNAFLGFASTGTNKWSVGNVQSDHRFRIYSEANTAELISVLQTGEFGIGIANPTTKLHIDGGASALIANLDANVSIAKSVSFRSDNSNRFNIEVSGTESGSNAGADFFIRRYSDAGSLIDTPLTITRSTGNATFSGILTTPQVKAATSAGLSINANSGTQVADFGAGGSANLTLFGGLSGTTISLSTNYSGGSVGMIHLTSNGTEGGAITFEKTSGTAQKYKIGCLNTNQFFVYNETAGNQPFTITSGGLVGIANILPSRTLDISGTFRVVTPNRSFFITSNAYSISDGTLSSGFGMDGDGMYLGNVTSSTGWTISNPQVTIRSNGNIGFGTTNPTLGKVVMEKSGSLLAGLCINNTTSDEATIRFKSTHDANSDYKIGASINIGSAFEIYSVNAATTRFAVTSGGNVLIGTTTNGSGLLQVNGAINNVGSSGLALGGLAGRRRIQWDTGNNEAIVLGDNDGFFPIGASAFNTRSDYRLKEDLKEFNALNKLMLIKTYDFKWIETGERQEGVIAHELQEILPYAVTGQKDRVNQEGNLILQGVDYSKIVPVLIKSIQEQQAQIEELKAKIK